MLYPSSALGHLSSTFRGDLPLDSTLSLLRSFTSCERSDDQSDSASWSSIQSLCALSLLGSHIRRLPGSLSRNLEPSSDQYRSSQGWRQEFLELTLQKWFASHATRPTPDALLLYHAVHLSLYTNFARIGRSAHLFLAQTTSSPSRGSSARGAFSGPGSLQREPESLSHQTSSIDRCFTSEEDHEKAVWHANRILQIAKEIDGDRTYNSGQRLHLVSLAETHKVRGVTHYSHAIYYASMVLWWSNSFQMPLPQSRSEEEKSTATKQALQQGIDLLSRSASRVAEVFKQILVSLESGE